MRRILVVTSGRADATPLAPVVRELEGRADVDRLDLGPYEFDELLGWAATKVYSADLVLVLGDRYEILAACLAATVAKVLIAHIHGGEITRGSFDNQIRDAITKLSHVHFCATQAAVRRVNIVLGESDSRIWLTGAPGLDNLTDLPPRVPTKTFVLTYHPETLGDNHAPAIAEALKAFPDYEVIWTGVNNDPGADEVSKAFGHYRERKLTAREYHLACRQAACVIGNSSSGIIECPALGVPTVNVGKRQEGREFATSVINVPGVVGLITEAINTALAFDLGVEMIGRDVPLIQPYGGPGASKKIADILTSIELDGLLVK